MLSAFRYFQRQTDRADHQFVDLLLIRRRRSFLIKGLSAKQKHFHTRPPSTTGPPPPFYFTHHDPYVALWAVADGVALFVLVVYHLLLHAAKGLKLLPPSTTASPPPPSSPLLRFIDEHGNLFKEEILDKCMCPHSRAMLARTGRACMEAVEASGLPRAGHRGSGGERLKVAGYFLSTVELLKWSLEKGNSMDSITLITQCTRTCVAAARSGHLETVKFCASMHEFEPPLLTIAQRDYTLGIKLTAAAAEGGQLEVLHWLRRNNVPWTGGTRLKAWELGYQYFRLRSNNDCSINDDDDEYERRAGKHEQSRNLLNY